MAKDPAFLFYPGDWLTGTMILSRHHKGCYMDLLVAQFNNGPLSLEMIKTVLGQDQAAWTVLSGKFREDPQGNFFNERLAAEIEKRKGFIDSRKWNGKRGGRPPNIKPSAKPNGLDMVNLPENENKNENGILVNREGVLGETAIYPIEDCLRIALYDSRWVKANRTDQHEVENFNHYLEKQGKYFMNPLDYKTYFAKLKGKYPDALKKELSVDELRKIAAKMDKEAA